MFLPLFYMDNLLQSQCHLLIWCIGMHCPQSLRHILHCQMILSNPTAVVHWGKPVYQSYESVVPPENQSYNKIIVIIIRLHKFDTSVWLKRMHLNKNDRLRNSVSSAKQNKQIKCKGAGGVTYRAEGPTGTALTLRRKLKQPIIIWKISLIRKTIWKNISFSFVCLLFSLQEKISLLWGRNHFW